MSRPTWYRRPDDQRLVLVLPVYNTAEDGIDGYDVAVLEMTPDYARQLLDRIARVAEMSKAEPDLATVRYWNTDVEYFPGDQDDDSADPHVACRPLWIGRSPLDGRTDTDRLDVTREGVTWHAYAKHTSVDLTTATLDTEDLRVYAAGGAPWLMGVAVCRIQWVDRDGKPTPDQNPAIGRARARARDVQIAGRTLHLDASPWWPICAEHAKRLTEPGMEWEFEPGVEP